MSMETKNSNEYSSKMIEAFIGKAEKTAWYQNAFSKYNINGIDTMQWNWSWWAFFMGWGFLLYRKQYGAAAILFIATIIISAAIPFLGWLIVSIVSGGYSTYFIYRGYKNKLNEVENSIEDEEKRIETMSIIGGYHSWVIWMYVIFNILIFLIFIVYFSLFVAMAPY